MAADPILFVDDDPDTCLGMSDVLMDFGFQVDTAPDGPAALALIVRRSYGLVLFDYRMPGIDGLELYRRIRRLFPEVAGVLVTGFASRELEAEALRAGVRRILAKPVDFAVLLPVVEGIVGPPGRGTS